MTNSLVGKLQYKRNFGRLDIVLSESAEVKI